MPTTQFKVDFLVFRDTLNELERLVDVCGNLSNVGKSTTIIEEGIVYRVKRLIEYDVNISELCSSVS